MKKFSDLKVGDEYFSTCTFSKKELESYLAFSRIKNTIFDDDEYSNIVSGRAIITRMEGEFTRLSQIYGNMILLYGMYTVTTRRSLLMNSMDGCLLIYSYVYALS